MGINKRLYSATYVATYVQVFASRKTDTKITWSHVLRQKGSLSFVTENVI